MLGLSKSTYNVSIVVKAVRVQVVAPVRETCAQTLGVALAQMREARVRLVAAALATLARQRQWEARHGALLAFKYLLAARQVCIHYFVIKINTHVCF